MNENLQDKPSGATNPLVGVASASEVLAAEKKADEKAARASMPDVNPYVTDLERYLADIFEDARKFKEDESGIQSAMIDCALRRNGEYSEEKLSAIKSQGSSEAYIPLTGMKCRAVEAFIHDIYMSAKKKRTWTLRPTPIVSLSDEDKQRISEVVIQKAMEMQAAQAQQQAEAGAAQGQVQEPAGMSPMEAYQMASDMRNQILQREYELASDKAEKMARKIDDQLTEGGWVYALSEAFADLATFPAMVIKGPIFRKRKVKSGWKGGKVQYNEKAVACFERVSPLDLYPSRHMRDVNDGTPLCERITMQRRSLVKNRHEKGYITKTIEDLILNGERSTVAGVSESSLALDRAAAEGLDSTGSSTAVSTDVIGSTIEGIEFSCSVRGRDMISFGILEDADGKPIDSIMDYEINAITVSGRIVIIDFNRDPLARRPYSVSGFAKELGGFWYRSPPQILKHIQDIINAAARAMVNNLSWASGPQVVIPDINRLAPSEDITNIFVGKIWQGVVSGAAATGKLIEFYQPDSRSAELIAVISKFTEMADVVIELPAYSYGSDKVAGAGRTSSGLSMLMSGSNKGMKRIVLDMDRNIFQSVINQLIDYNLENSDDESIKGDMNVYSEGVVAVMMREQLSEQRLKFLQSTTNEFDMRILGMDGRAKILAEAIESLESDYDDIKPTAEKIRKMLEREEIIEEQRIRENEMKIQKEMAIIEREAQVAQQEAEVAMAKLELQRREQDLEFENKERELDVRAEKQSGDRMIKQQQMEDKRAETAAKAQPAGKEGA